MVENRPAMRALIKVIFNVKLAFSAHTRAVWVAFPTFSAYITQWREIPTRRAFTLGAALLCFPRPLPQRLLVLPFSLKDSPRRAGSFKAKDIDGFYFSMPGQSVFFLIF